MHAVPSRGVFEMLFGKNFYSPFDAACTGRESTKEVTTSECYQEDIFLSERTIPDNGKDDKSVGQYSNYTENDVECVGNEFGGFDFVYHFFWCYYVWLEACVLLTHGCM